MSRTRRYRTPKGREFTLARLTLNQHAAVVQNRMVLLECSTSSINDAVDEILKAKEV